MISIVLHGKLAKKFSGSYQLEVSSAKEAVHALSLLVDGFREEFSKYNYLTYSLINGEKVYLDEADIGSTLVADNLHFSPRVTGAKSNTQKGVGKLILSAALFFVAGPLGTALGNAGGVVGALAPAAVTVTQAISSVAMFTALRGISLMLTPKEVDGMESKSISADNSANNVPVPLAYGEGFFDVIPISVLISSNGVSSFGGATQDNIDWTYIDVE